MSEASTDRDQYLYGIVHADSELTPSLQGVQGQPVRLVAHGDVAAVVSDMDPVEVLGTPEDLLGHTRLLDTVASDTSVLPLAFGTVLPGDADIGTEVLEPRESGYLSGLQAIDGHSQYTLLVRFDRETLLREIVEDVPEAAQLRETIAGTTEDETRPQRIRLGEIIVRSFEARQPGEAEPILEKLRTVTADMTVHEQGQPDDVAEIAVLVAYDGAEAFEEAVEELAEEKHPRLTFRLVGPQAPYDFVPEV